MAKAKSASKGGNPVTRYLRETMGELRKVSWPSRDDATRLTIIVLVVLLVTSAMMGVLDYLFGQLFGIIITLG